MAAIQRSVPAAVAYVLAIAGQLAAGRARCGYPPGPSAGGGGSDTVGAPLPRRWDQGGAHRDDRSRSSSLATLDRPTRLLIRCSISTPTEVEFFLHAPERSPIPELMVVAGMC